MTGHHNNLDKALENWEAEGAMAKKTTKTGKALERQVADAYRAIGARKVEHDVELAGHQIDVYVELGTTADH